MSKYYKAEDIIKAYNEAVQELVEAKMKEFDLGDFTECSFNTTQLKLIPRKIESLPTIEVSEDCISREYMLRALNGYGKDWQEDCEIADVIRNAPSVVPTTEQSSEIGEWIEIEVCDNNVDEWQSAKCSVCGKYHTTPYLYYFDNFNYCPNCGAKMKG